jgi:hypothetical protein
MSDSPGISLSLNQSEPKTETSRSVWVYVLGAVILLLVGYLFYAWMRSYSGNPLPSLFGGSTASEDQVPAAIDGKERTVVPAIRAPMGESGDYGMQFWMFIKDWDYKFGQEKDIVKRIASNSASVSNPRISMHPTDNSLNVTVNYFSNNASAAETTQGSTNAGGDSFTCTVENVPLQAWFSVSVTLFDRNMDIYINGRLVKSCVLPGVPKPAGGDIILNDNGGFSGSICNLRSYSAMLSPSDAQTFFATGTTCGAPSMEADDDSLFARIFGYTFRLSIFNYKGSEVSKYTF